MGTVQITRKRQSYIGVDLMRFLAALSVLCYHLGFWRWLPTVSSSAPPSFVSLASYAQIFRWGRHGVAVFFVISGFVIALSASRQTPVQFVESRFLRLYPVAIISATLIVLLAEPNQLWSFAYLRSIALCPIGPWVSGVYWTLGIEVMFYTFTTCILIARIPITLWALVLGGTSSVYWIARTADHALGNHLHSAFQMLDSQAGALTLLPSGCFFALGMILHNRDLIRKGQIATVIALASLLACCLSLVASGQYDVRTNGGPSILAIVPVCAWLASLGFIAASVVYADVVNRHFGRYAKGARAIGLLTYPLYLLHSEIGAKLMLSSHLPGTTALVVAVVTVIGMSALVAFVSERIADAIKPHLFSARARRDLDRLPASLP